MSLSHLPDSFTPYPPATTHLLPYREPGTCLPATTPPHLPLPACLPCHPLPLALACLLLLPACLPAHTQTTHTQGGTGGCLHHLPTREMIHLGAHPPLGSLPCLALTPDWNGVEWGGWVCPCLPATHTHSASPPPHLPASQPVEEEEQAHHPPLLLGLIR